MKKLGVGCALYHLKCFPFSSSSSEEESVGGGVIEKKVERKPGGWKSMPYVIGNETFEKLATIGLMANFMVFLLTQFHLKQVFATNVINIWSGTANFAPLMG